MKHFACLAGIACVVATWLAGCGGIAGGDQGSESHWLSTCVENADCGVGECLCGVCTTRCDAALDCPFPLDRCTSPGQAPQGGTCTTPHDGGLCSVSDPQRLRLSETKQIEVAACDAGRTSTLYWTPDVDGSYQCDSLGDVGYALFGGPEGSGVRILDRDGYVARELPLPTAGISWLFNVLPRGDGSFALSGRAGGSAGDAGWIGSVDADWNLLWEVTVGGDGVASTYVVPLADGGVVFAGSTWDQGFPSGPPANFEPSVFWGRIDDSGQILWQREQQVDLFQGHALLALTPEQALRVVVPTADGLVLFRGDLDGASDTMLLDTDPALYLEDIAALPGERLAIASSREPGAALTLVGADGTVEWDKMYDAQEYAQAGGLAYDATRNELVLAGLHVVGERQSTWMIATDLEGNRIWELKRGPLETVGAEGEIVRIANDSGPGLHDVVMGTDGQMLALGFSSVDLTYFLVNPEACE